MSRSQLNLAAVRSIALAIACSSFATALALPTRAADYQQNNANNRQPNSSYQNRTLSQQTTQSPQTAQIDATQSALSPEELERQSVQQNRWLQDLEWRRQFGDLDPTPVGK